jgi:hypothetical protein
MGSVVPADDSAQTNLRIDPHRPGCFLFHCVLRRVGRRDSRRLRIQGVSGRPAHDGPGRDSPVCRPGLHQGYRHYGLARARRLRLGRGVRRSAGYCDGDLPADWRLLRTVRVVRAVSAGVGVHTAPDPVGGYRRNAKAAGDFHRFVFPSCCSTSRSARWTTRRGC